MATKATYSMARCTAPKLIAAKIVTKGARIAPVKMLLATGMIVVGGLACASSKLMKNDNKRRADCRQQRLSALAGKQKIEF